MFLLMDLNFRMQDSGPSSKYGHRRSRSIKNCQLARKHGHIMRAVYKEFQGMFFSLHGPLSRWESVHRESNALLLIDAARKALGADSSEFRIFSKDILSQIGEGGEIR